MRGALVLLALGAALTLLILGYTLGRALACQTPYEGATIMSKRLTIVLTDEEYADLERRALEDRRTVRQMAERLVTLPHGNGLTIRTSPNTITTPYVNPQTWWQNPTTSDNGSTITALPIGTSGWRA